MTEVTNSQMLGAGTLPIAQSLPAHVASSELSTESESAVGLDWLTHYVVVDRAPCFLRPVRSLDSVVAVLPYGTRVIVEEFQGRWARVSRGNDAAWVEKDVLTTDRNDIYPQFENGIIYEASHPVTMAVRHLLCDEFNTAELFLPLQDIEYVTYRLHQHKFYINWPPDRPRLAGTWHTMLRGVPRVHMYVFPVATGLMEYIDEFGHGHLLFVERVFTDDSIEVSGVGERIEGRFERHRIGKEVWQKHRPVFIEVT